MKFSVKSNEFQECFQKVVGVIPTKTTLSILNGILFHLEGDVLELTGTDLEISLRTKLQVEGEIDGSIVLPGKDLHNLFRALPETSVTFDVDDKMIARIITSAGEYEYPGENSSEFPALPQFEIKNKVEIDSELFIRMIEKTIFAVSSGEIRSSLMGLYLQFFTNELRAVSTDRHRLVKIKKEFNIGEEFGGHIVSTKALNLLLRSIEDKEKISLMLSENYMVFDIQESVIYSRLLEGMYPDYDKVIPPDNNNTLKINREMLESSLRRMAICSNKITQQIKLDISKDKVELYAEDPDSGKKGKESIPAEFDGENLIIGYNVNYLADILRHIDTEDILFTFSGPTNAGLIYPSKQQEKEELLMLIMPIKIN